MTQIRIAKKEDIEQILSIAKQVQKMVQQRRSKFFGETREFGGDSRHYLKAIMAKDNVIFVAEKEKADVVGYLYAAIEKEPDDLIAVPYVSVNEIAVKKEYRRSGIGKPLMYRVHRWARENGITVVQLATWEFNGNAAKFFEVLGYKTIMRKMEKVLE